MNQTQTGREGFMKEHVQFIKEWWGTILGGTVSIGSIGAALLGCINTFGATAVIYSTLIILYFRMKHLRRKDRMEQEAFIYFMQNKDKQEYQDKQIRKMVKQILSEDPGTD